MFFVIDHYRYYELKNKIKSTSYLAASMIQQLGNNRSNKQLTITDLKNIAFASYLNFFQAKDMYPPYKFGIHPRMGFVYVKRNSSNSYTYQMSYILLDRDYNSTSVGAYTLKCTTRTSCTEAEIKSINPDLVCFEDNDERVMVWGIYAGSSYNKSKLGFFIMPVNVGESTCFGVFPPYVNSGNNKKPFQYQLVFTPKPGLFPIK